MSSEYCKSISHWVYVDDALLVKILKAIKGGMTESWEYKERFGKKTPMDKLKNLGFVKYSKKDGYTITPEGDAWLAEKLKCKR